MAGFRFLARDSLLRPWSAALILGDVISIALFAAVPVLVLTRFGEQPQTVGLIFAAFGVGAVVGSAVAMRIVRSVDRMLLVSVAELGMAAPLWVFVFHVPAAVLVAATAAAGLCNGLVNAPLHTIVTLRTPPHLRTKLFSAVIASTAIDTVAVGLFARAGLRHRAALAAAAAQPA